MPVRAKPLEGSSSCCRWLARGEVFGIAIPVTEIRLAIFVVACRSNRTIEIVETIRSGVGVFSWLLCFCKNDIQKAVRSFGQLQAVSPVDQFDGRRLSGSARDRIPLGRA